VVFSRQALADVAGSFARRLELLPWPRMAVVGGDSAHTFQIFFPHYWLLELA
jgi:hypothetical protein